MDVDLPPGVADVHPPGQSTFCVFFIQPLYCIVVCAFSALTVVTVGCLLSYLASLKSRLVLPFWYWQPQVVLEKRPLNGCSSSCVVVVVMKCLVLPVAVQHFDHDDRKLSP